jgi:glycosyltransferase involved in cell wall biosynthesis
VNLVVIQDRLRSGGTERQSVLLARAFSEAGHDTTLLTFRPGGALASTVGELRHDWLQPFDLGLDWFAPGLISRLRALAPDLVLCMGRMANCHAGWIKRALPRVSVVASMRTGKRLPFLYRRSLRSVDHVVANSREARTTLIETYGIAPDRISAIANTLVFRPESDSVHELDLRKEQQASPSTFVMACVAMFRPEKNQRELIEIVANLPRSMDWQLWLAGDGPALADCHHLVEEGNLATRVKFIGWHRNPRAIYDAADLAVHASWSESLSNFIIEAQAHGLPVVAYHAQGNRECLIDGDTGFIIPKGDHEAFRSALLRLADESAEQRAQRAARARAFAKNSFDASTLVGAYLRLFSGLRSQAKASSV